VEVGLEAVRNKKLKSKIMGLQRLIDEHRRKIAMERVKPISDEGLIRFGRRIPQPNRLE
jgi:hypothetical protein